MRVISGSAKGRKLKQVPGETTRPITDRVKESLFDILGYWVADTYWLDLFAGTGQVAIEALSRGASGAVLVDRARTAVTVILANLRHTELDEWAEVIHRDAFVYLKASPAEPFDVIYVAPPQYKGIWIKVMQILDARIDEFLTEIGLVIVQIDPKEYQALPLKKLTLMDQRRYGRTMLCFYERPLTDNA